MTMPDIGYFVLHSSIVPAVTAGTYQLQSHHEGLPSDKDHTALKVAPQTAHLKVTAPRYVMPTDQILSSFPPANAEGGFANRLPQIVLKRRTLPWERHPVKRGRNDPAPPPPTPPNPAPPPWLALVVVAEGEASLSKAPVSVAECVTAGCVLPQPDDRDLDTGLRLEVTQTVVNKIFPTLEDLPLLTHVREVNISDTELMGGDDDGWVAVVMANRLPVTQPDGTPVRYMACLVNVEQQLDVLPVKPPADESFAFGLAQDWRALGAVEVMGPDAMVQGAGVLANPVVQPGIEMTGTPVMRDASGGAKAAAGGNGASASGPVIQGGSINGAQGLNQSQKSGQWRSSPVNPTTQVPLATHADDAQRTIRQVMASGFHFPIAQYAVEPVYRFPVLAHWSFTTNEGATFESLMQGLDVDLLGSLPATDAAPAAAGSGATPPPPPQPQDTLPEIVGTGHIGLAQRTRRGDAVRAWYRGPCVPFPTARSGQADTATSHHPLPLAHSADQLRRVIPDGREDLALASAFEIGRLLALSQLSVVSALLRFRSQQFGAGRLRELLQMVMPFDLPALLSDGGARQVNLGRFIAVQMIDAMAQNTERMLGQPRPLVDPGRPLAIDGALDQLIATGLGLDLKALTKQAQTVGWTQALHQAPVATVAAQVGETKLDVARLQSQLQGELQRTLDVAAPAATIGKSSRAAPRPDPLGALLGPLAEQDDPDA